MNEYHREVSIRGTFPFQPKIYGQSHLGIPLEVWLPDNTEAIEILIIAGIHGVGEPETTKLLSNAFRTIKPEALKCALVLTANPDGMVRGTRENLNGVDLNRNFPTSNWQKEPILYSWQGENIRQVKISTGVSPSSELETKALLNLISEIKPKIIISIHSDAACIDDPDNSEIGKWLSKYTKLPHILEYDHPTPGSLWTWGKENGISIITYELPDQSINTIRKQQESVLVDLLCGLYPHN